MNKSNIRPTTAFFPSEQWFLSTIAAHVVQEVTIESSQQLRDEGRREAKLTSKSIDHTDPGGGPWHLEVIINLPKWLIVACRCLKNAKESHENLQILGDLGLKKSSRSYKGHQKICFITCFSRYIRYFFCVFCRLLILEASGKNRPWTLLISLQYLISWLNTAVGGTSPRAGWAVLGWRGSGCFPASSARSRRTDTSRRRVAFDVFRASFHPFTFNY